MNNEAKNVKEKNQITFNNAKVIVDRLKSEGTDYEEKFLTMVQGNTFGGVDISESNIRNNSQFIVDLWD